MHIRNGVLFLVIVLGCIACSNQSKDLVTNPDQQVTPTAQVMTPTNISEQPIGSNPQVTAVKTNVVPISNTPTVTPIFAQTPISNADDCGNAQIIGDISKLALHETPSLKSAVIAEMDRGSQVTKLCEVVAAETRAWNRIAFNEKIGWVNAIYLQPIDLRWEPIAILSIGSDAHSVGYNLNTAGGRSPYGPEAFSIDSNGTIYLLDTVNARIQQIDQGQIVKAIPFPEPLWPIDILVTDQSIYLLTTQEILELTYNGSIINRIKLPESLSLPITFYRLWNRGDGQIMLWCKNYHEFDINNLPEVFDLEAERGDFTDRGIHLPLGHRVIVHAILSAAGIFLINHEDVISQNQLSIDGIYIIGFDQASNIYFKTETVRSADKSNGMAVDLQIIRIAPNGDLISAIAFPASAYVTIPHRSAEITPDGTIYLLVTELSQTIIYRLKP